MTRQRALHMLPTAAESRVRLALMATLQEAREILHREARLSSRHEALDELAKLIFAHVISIDTGGDGIGQHIHNGKAAAPALASFVRDCFLKHLPQSMPSAIAASSFELNIHSSEGRLASELIRCFAEFAPKHELLQARGAGQLDLLNDAFGQFLADAFVDDKEFGQYLTPPEVTTAMVRLGLASLSEEELSLLCSLDDGHNAGIILDPSCGVGSFLAEALRALYSKAKRRLCPGDLSLWTENVLKNNIVGIDKSERMVRLAVANLALFGAPAANLHLANSLLRGSDAERICDSLVGAAKLILTNPPFGATFSGDDLWEYQIARRWASRVPKSVDSELLFLERYLDWLAPGGVLVSIVPDNVLNGRGIFKDFREAIASSVEVLSVVSLPSVTFAAAGTSTKTSILHLRKSKKLGQQKTYFSICRKIGYAVSTRGAIRRKVRSGESELPPIVEAAVSEASGALGRWMVLERDAPRWDATYHAGLPDEVRERVARRRRSDMTVSDVASLSRDRVEPKAFGNAVFRYVEISDVDPRNCTVGHKLIKSEQAPSRARKRIKAGDVLFATVRPERRAIGVVGQDLDGGVCSTGFAVLRPSGIDPLTLARLMQSDFVNAQILRNSAGIAYPAVDEACLMSVLLPVQVSALQPLERLTHRILALSSEMYELEKSLSEQVECAVTDWLERES